MLVSAQAELARDKAQAELATSQAVKLSSHLVESQIDERLRQQKQRCELAVAPDLIALQARGVGQGTGGAVPAEVPTECFPQECHVVIHQEREQFKLQQESGAC